MDAKRQKKAEELLLAEASFRTNAFRIINIMIELYVENPGCKVHVDEILHSIFFLGLFRKPQQCTPNDILGEFKPEVQEIFPRPFENYNSKLPRRTPFSSVLDMVVSSLRPDIEINILVERLHQIANGMSEPNSKYKFNSSTICVSQGKDVQRSYYGASMSCNGKQEGQIMVAVSCLSTWHCGVSNAVMTYDPNTKKMRENFDHTFNLPTDFRCQAFNLRTRDRMDPCKSCHNLFGLEPRGTQMWPYGNCAEAESLSKLFKGEGFVARRVVDDEVRMEVIQSVRSDLQRKLRSIEYEWDGDYYIPL
ncbi:uncharacterized protein LOC116352800 isoform X1 [Oncorhynchus kisutch]|uniref:uncharacterized protein LOC116352800 isoform X1 n=2 Tax=Oncorhynchus kisutch TaxID=8019 RepID=UPI0012DE80D9|nr:uncharacterized protein LOC116352800 isoform X1 [Oncorhynchus kisutch]